jgi:hypothetical protein
MDALNHSKSAFGAARGGGAAVLASDVCGAAGGHAHNDLQRDLEVASLELLTYCRGQEWAGWDPYDGLDSAWLHRLPLRNSRVLRVLVIQLNKYSPINMRPLLGIGKSRNPKALALCLSALVRLFRLHLLRSTDPIVELVDLLQDSRSPHAHDSWGYSFPWQTRSRLVPKGHPNLVCTVFAANALLDAHALLGDERCLEMAKGAATFISEDLYSLASNGQPTLAYPLPDSKVPVHNANLLGAAFLVRMHRYGAPPLALERGLGLARHAASRQHADGSWSYGESPHWRWVDNFHTGFNLCALHDVAQQGRTQEFDGTLERGFDFYRRNLFLPSGAPRYRADRTFPIDIHCVAQALITLPKLQHLDPGNLDMAARVYRWAAAHLRDEDGHFHYQAWPWATVRIAYMRWSQAWMLLAMATLLGALVPHDAHARPAEDMAHAD